MLPDLFFQKNDNENSKDDQRTNASEVDSEYWPNCDASIWLRSCKAEVIDPIRGCIRGCVPKWLRGTLLRNGPGNLVVGQFTMNHLFDSSALLHRYGSAYSLSKVQNKRKISFVCHMEVHKFHVVLSIISSQFKHYKMF